MIRRALGQNRAVTETAHSDPVDDSNANAPADSAAASAADESQHRREVIRKRVIDAIAVFVLSAVAVLTAWCGFQSSKWGGEMSIAFSEASSARVQSIDFASQSRDARAGIEREMIQDAGRHARSMRPRALSPR